MRGAEADLEKLESFSLQSFRGQRGERRAQTLLTEAQGLTLPQDGFWERKEKHTTHKHTHSPRKHMHAQTNIKIEFQSCNDSTAAFTHTALQS